MSGWIVALLLAAAVLTGLWRCMRADAGALQIVGAALLLALAGYAWQGRPELVGTPKLPAARDTAPATAFALFRRSLLGEFNAASGWLTLAESYQRTGDTETAVVAVRRAIELNPRSIDLWIGLGNALVVHANGVMTPAAALAFHRAAQIAPTHPAPPFFYGAALAQAGRFDQAEVVWRAVLVAPTTTAVWRSATEQQLGVLARVRAGSRSAPPAN